MENKLENPKWSIYFKVLLFIATVVIIVQLFPREGKFRLHYQLGQPWQHELLMAPFDFPIFKSEAQIRQERDSVAASVLLFYDLRSNIADEKILQFNSDFPSNVFTVRTLPYRRYISEKLTHVYSVGIISAEELNRLAIQNQSQISIMDRHISSTQNVSNLFTIESAYRHIMDNVPPNLIPQTLNTHNIRQYLTENLFHNEDLTNMAREEKLRNISITVGIVQAGEKIIDRGEIVNARVYQILNSLKRETESQVSTGTNFILSLIGQILLVSGLMLFAFLYLFLFRSHIFARARHLLFILMMVVLMITLLSLTLSYTELTVYIIPFALLPIIVRTFLDSRTALFMHVITILLASFMVPSPFEFILLQIIVGMVVIFSLKDLTQRSQLVQVAGLIVLTYSLVYLSYSLAADGDLSNVRWIMFVNFLANGLLLLFAYGLIYIFEKTFGFLSNVTLVELSNVNSPLMMKFSETAPGTFQHSLQVASLATEAASKVNANSLLVRVGALYHDIGKMANPMYFIENQQGIVNPLSELEFDEAAQIVINHVAEGVKIAQKHNLPEPVIEFIKTHHAESKAKYFYNSFRNKYPEKIVDEKKFTYPGPKPSSKETAILMMADAIEAASRSLPEYTEEALSKMVDNIIDGQIAEGSFKNAPITFKHIESIKEIFKQKLKNIYHSRITYPELKQAKNE